MVESRVFLLYTLGINIPFVQSGYASGTGTMYVILTLLKGSLNFSYV